MSTSVAMKEKAAKSVEDLALVNLGNKVLTGAIVPFVDMLSYGGLQEAAARANDANKVKIADAGAVNPLVRLLLSGSAVVQKEAAGVLALQQTTATRSR